MNKPKRLKTLTELAEILGVKPMRAAEAEVKASLTKAIIREVAKQGLTHHEVADLAGVARTTVTGVINGSLQKVSIDRLLRIISAIGLSVHVSVKKSA
jgi:predicted XRE-type DNA-binding protein